LELPAADAGDLIYIPLGIVPKGPGLIHFSIEIACQLLGNKDIFAHDSGTMSGSANRAPN
jgi:hypothetical protein